MSGTDLKLDLKRRVLAAQVAATQPKPTDKIGLRIGGAVVQVPATYTPEQRTEAINKFRQSPEFANLIDRQTGAPARVRAQVGGIRDPASRLATIRRFYPDAVPHGEENFVFTDPETGKPTLYNPTGFDAGDIASVAREGFQLAGSGLGALFGGTSGLAAGPGAPVAVPTLAALGAGAGNVLAGEAFDVISETLLGSVDERSLVQQASDVFIDFFGGAIGQRGGELLEQGTKAALGGGKQAAKTMIDNFNRFRVKPAAGAVTGSRALQTVESALEAAPGSSSVMQQQAVTVIKQVQEAAEKITAKIATPKTDAGAGDTAVSAATKAGEKFFAKNGKVYDDVFEEIGDDTIVRVDALRELRLALQQRLARAPNSLEGDLAPGLKQLDNIIADAEASGGGVQFGALREIRTGIGKNIKEPHLSGQTSAQNGVSKQIYAALTDDLGVAAGSTSAKAAAQLKKADAALREFKTGAAKTLDKITAMDSDEKVFRFIYNSTRDNGRALQRMRKHFDPEDWDTVVASVLNKLGRSNPGAQNAAGDAFSISTFLTNWSKLTPEAKAIMFKNSRYNGVAGELDGLMKVVEALKGAQAVANSSNTARTLMTYSLISALGSSAGAALTGDVPGAAGGLVTAVGGAILAPRAAAKLITSQAFVKWLATPVTQVNGLGAHLGRLAAIGKTNPEIQNEVHQYLMLLRGSPEARNDQ